MANGTAESSVETLSDAALLQRFAKHRDEAAFAELVSRHGRLVWGVCRRRLARREDAEDAFQAAFLILAVKAHAIRSAEALPGWLHRTACRAAIRVATASPVEAMHDVPTDGLDAFAEVTRREAATAIDEELVRLPERYRNAVVLFHLEGLERRDVATRLGMSEPAVKALLTRGRALLRTRLARRGLALPMLFPLVLDPVPASAAASTCKLALAFSRAGLRPLDLVNLPAKGLKPMSALLTNKTVAACAIGVACLTLFLATRGDANANSDGQNPSATINSAFDPADDVEATPVLLAEAELLANAAEEPKPAEAKKATAGEPQASEPPQVISRLPKELKIREALLESDAEVSFPNTPLRDALQFLADLHNINIIIDEQALEDEGLTVDDNVDIVLKDITLRSTLDILLSRYDLTNVLED
jgi:RNA polymerase sigma factor (sigma-70 family)